MGSFEPKVVAGIDPGMTGGAAAVRTTGVGAELVDAIPIPLLTLPVGKVLAPHLFDLWLKTVCPSVIVLERVHAMPGKGAKSMFNFGRITGAIEAACLYSGRRIEWVTAAQWKRGLGVPADKRAAMDLATVRFGQDAKAKYWPTLSKNGLAEAALIASWWIERRGQKEGGAKPP